MELLPSFYLVDDVNVQDSFRKSQAIYEEHLESKHRPTLDGVMCTYPGYKWRLLSDRGPFKQESQQLQWFYRALKAHEHYVPVCEDLSDLTKQVVFAKELNVR